MFVYCLNNPLYFVDNCGDLPREFKMINANAMAIGSALNPSCRPIPWDENGELLDTPATRWKRKKAERENVGILQLGEGAEDIVSGVDQISSGATKILAPCPTVADDLIGVAQGINGVFYIAIGVTKVVIGLIRWDESGKT